MVAMILSIDLIADVLVDDTVVAQDRIADRLEEAIEDVHHVVGEMRFDKTG